MRRSLFRFNRFVVRAISSSSSSHVDFPKIIPTERFFDVIAYLPFSLLLVALADNQHTSCSDEIDEIDSFRDPKLDIFYNQLKSQLRKDQITTNRTDCALRGKPWNSYHKISDHPDIVVFPESTDDVSKIMKLCFVHGIPVVPFGGGTSIEGQTLAPQRGCSIDFERMKQIVELNETDLDVRVQAGIGYVELNETLREKNLWFPLDPGPGASIGGMCACRCSGSTAVRYGSMRENVLGLTAVLSDGTIIKTGTRARKSSAGYDLTRLLIGSEGTLAVITEAVLKLHVIPQVSYAIRVSFPSVKQAAEAAKQTLNCGVTVGRCELLDDTMIGVVNKANPSLAPWPVANTLMYEITGPSDSSVQEQLEIIRKICLACEGTHITIATEPEENRLLWKIRKEALWSIMSTYPDKEPMITDVCVPLSKLPELIATTRVEIDKSPLPCPIVAHAGDGNFHAIIMFDPDSPEEKAEAKRLAEQMAVRAIEMGGTCTGEHGIGMGKKDLLELEAGPGAINLMRTIKLAVDPALILNPGKVVDMPVIARIGRSSVGGCG